MFDLCFGMNFFVSFLVLQSSSNWRERARTTCCALIASLYLVTINVMWFFLTVSWVSLQFVIVVFPDHTYLLINQLKLSSFHAM